jgi:hypothetical protein
MVLRKDKLPTLRQISTQVFYMAFLSSPIDDFCLKQKCALPILYLELFLEVDRKLKLESWEIPCVVGL